MHPAVFLVWYVVISWHDMYIYTLCVSVQISAKHGTGVEQIFSTIINRIPRYGDIESPTMR